MPVSTLPSSDSCPALCVLSGTGKTLCLICAALAVLEEEKIQKGGNGVKPSGEPAIVLGGGGTGFGVKQMGRVIYASRTHSQLKQVVKELRATKYVRERGFRCTVVGSREHLCVNEKLANLSGSQKDAGCRKLLEQRRAGFCPFFGVREVQQESHVVLVPYNYLFDPSARRALRLDEMLSDAIVVVDEAHNIERVCEEAASFDVTTDEIDQMHRELTDVVNAYVTSMSIGGGEAGEGEGGSSMLSESLQKWNPTILTNATHLLNTINNLRQHLESIALNRPSHEWRSKYLLLEDGARMLDLFKEAGFTFYPEQARIITDASEFLASGPESIDVPAGGGESLHGGTESGWKRSTATKGKYLEKLAKIIKQVSSPFVSDDPLAFRPVIQEAQREAQISSSLQRDDEEIEVSTRRRNNQGTYRILSLWCFSAAAAVSQVLSKKTRSLILTSGTLAPLGAFSAQLCSSKDADMFPVTLQNPHVIREDQLWAGVISRGPTKKILTSTFQNREQETYLDDLGRVVFSILKTVPGGVLLVFASYIQMKICQDRWKATRLWEAMGKQKTLFQEPQNSKQLANTLSAFKNEVETHTRAVLKGAQTVPSGAALLAVCRGKVSEGVDFSDSACRAVVVLGQPLPNAMDPRVHLKREYMDRRSGELKRMVGNGRVREEQRSAVLARADVDGQKWYAQQASRAVNQAIGRVIRHRDDFGAIILCDARFAHPNVQRDLSRWIFGSLRPEFLECKDAIEDLDCFFKNVPKDLKDKERDKLLSISIEGEEGNSFSSSGLPQGYLESSGLSWGQAERGRVMKAPSGPFTATQGVQRDVGGGRERVQRIGAPLVREGLPVSAPSLNHLRQPQPAAPTRPHTTNTDVSKQKAKATKKKHTVVEFERPSQSQQQQHKSKTSSQQSKGSSGASGGLRGALGGGLRGALGGGVSQAPGTAFASSTGYGFFNRNRVAVPPQADPQDQMLPSHHFPQQRQQQQQQGRLGNSSRRGAHSSGQAPSGSWEERHLAASGYPPSGRREDPRGRGGRTGDEGTSRGGQAACAEREGARYGSSSSSRERPAEPAEREGVGRDDVTDAPPPSSSSSSHAGVPPGSRDGVDISEPHSHFQYSEKPIESEDHQEHEDRSEVDGGTSRRPIASPIDASLQPQPVAAVGTAAAACSSRAPQTPFGGVPEETAANDANTAWDVNDMSGLFGDFGAPWWTDAQEQAGVSGGDPAGPSFGSSAPGGQGGFATSGVANRFVSPAVPAESSGASSSYLNERGGHLLNGGVPSSTGRLGMRNDFADVEEISEDEDEESQREREEKKREAGDDGQAQGDSAKRARIRGDGVGERGSTDVSPVPSSDSCPICCTAVVEGAELLESMKCKHRACRVCWDRILSERLLCPFCKQRARRDYLIEVVEVDCDLD
uniref:Regulator of telomere elongation helicase 1 homolog n=1 Tax=Chromera velia CCMP2878 TaxID=1169474 RepID=A0A0G4IE49_9ALVE|eukprot:Cvel_13557.t1-p1 / transcript=Cvel_13557.t1 / gene=Cvel_13557 / organism=Chromera_velia_CCMP2878 / gene_product=Regulator of telomere elongation helicase 1 homolog, putative / transcript_product=Regulator of telomere elongation helicase 1 homolog, putative / location=Cvel_scaffold931:34712-46312(+) / protein_length=1406 / sequence_SO=supercontig / SO=protein_coding / is_pseudo=false